MKFYTVEASRGDEFFQFVGNNKMEAARAALDAWDRLTRSEQKRTAIYIEGWYDESDPIANPDLDWEDPDFHMTLQEAARSFDPGKTGYLVDCMVYDDLADAEAEASDCGYDVIPVTYFETAVACGFNAESVDYWDGGHVFVGR